MSRGFLAGLVVGLVGDVAVFVAQGLEDLFFSRTRQWFANSAGGFADPGSLGLSASTATMGSAVLTLAMGLAFGLLFQQARPGIAHRGAAMGFGVLCWLGFLVPIELIHLMWTKAPLAAAACNLLGWLVMLTVGGVIAYRLTRREDQSRVV